MKNRFIAYVAASIDGRISITKKTKPSWTSQEDWNFFQTQLAKADAMVVGRNTYEAAKIPLQKRNTFVLSSLPKTLIRKGKITFVNPDIVNLKILFKEYKKVAIVGGGQVYQTMLDLGLLDELYLTIEPLVFGYGKNMFVNGTKKFSFILKSIKKLNSAGTLLLHYIKKP